MNIFYLDHDIQKCVQYTNNRHVVKMILESFQLLSSAHHICGQSDSPFLYRKTHANHPAAVWTRDSLENYLWLVDYTKELCREYEFRYGRTHKSAARLPFFIQNVPKIDSKGLTKRPLCMPDDCKVEDPVESYRKYYRKEKGHLAQWKGRQIPDWW